VGFVEWDGDPREWLDTLPGQMLHLRDAWSRRAAHNVVPVHFDDLLRDLDGSMRSLAARLDFAVDEAVWPELVRAATFDEMKQRSATSAPETLGVLKDPVAFFRHGTSGDGRAILTPGELARYRERVASLAPADLLAWVHREPVS
jgi:hypothetical protein